MRHAALVWLLVGSLMVVRGLLWVGADPRIEGWFPLILLGAVLVGVFKGVVVLRRAAIHAVARIHTLAERSPAWHLYSPATYLLVAGMIVAGTAFRWAGIHWHLTSMVGALYLVVGIALIAGSRTFWQASVVTTGLRAPAVPPHAGADLL